MAEYTENYNLKKPGQDEFYKVEDANSNMDAIDTALTPAADPALVPEDNDPGKLVQWVSWIVNRIKAITGLANWWDTPTRSLEDLNDTVNEHLADIVNYGQFKLSATQNINVADGAQINFDTVEKENKDYYILATGDNAGKIKILKDGVYDIELQIRLFNVTLTDFKGMSSQVMHNGVSKANAFMAFKANNTFISNRAYTKVSALSVVCKANDLISAFIVTNTTDMVSIEGTGTIQTYLRIRKVG